MEWGAANKATLHFTFCAKPALTGVLMSPVLKLILESERLDIDQMAQVLDLSEAEVAAEMERLQAEHTQEEKVRAVIEVRISPERSGGFHLLLFATGKGLHEVATFVSERLASVQGVLSTATHFMLRIYKEQWHFLLSLAENGDKPAVSP